MIKTKLIFSTGFDSYVYKTDNKLFNTKFVGELQLLSFLERELALSIDTVGNKERQAEYLEYISKEIESKDTFISESFNNDSIGVANELLKWRDQLKLCNWNFNNGVSSRLDLLANIENNNSLSIGKSDRWILVLKKLQNANNLNIESIEINDKIELLHPIYIEIFSLLEKTGVTIINNKIEISQNKETNLFKIKDSILNKKSKIELDKADKSFQIIRFKDSIVSADFLAQQLSISDFSPIIINNNNYALDTSFLTYKTPLSGSEISETNPQIIQLFKLIGALLFSKVNPYNLLSLLNLPMLPFPKSLANKLSKTLIDSAGIGNEEWTGTISDFKLNINKENNNWKEKLKAIELYIERERAETVKKEDLINIYRDIASWSATMLSIAKNNGIKTQLSNLQMLSKSFVKTIESVNEKQFMSREFDNIINKIYEPINISINAKEKGSHTVLKQTSQLYNNADTLLWFDFYNQDLSARFCDFLMQLEIKELISQNDFLFWTKEKQIQLQLDNLQKGILKTENNLCLFISDKTSGGDTTEHPLYTQLYSSISNLDEFIFDYSFETKDWQSFNWTESQFTEIEKIELPKECDYIEISKQSLLKKRKTESYSSINDLIQNPLDWLMNYQAKITEKGLGNIDELITLKGNLSHIITQTLLQNEKDEKIDLSKADIDGEIDKLLIEYTPKIASPFYLDENTFEYKTFAIQLKKSIKVLLKIIKNNNLKYHSFEYKAEGKIDIIDFAGNIDLLFYKDDLPVIIDLKWTFSTKKYEKILENEKSIQLAMYAKLTGNSSAITGYFLLSDASLYTTSKFINGEGVRFVKLEEDANSVNNRILERTIKSFNYRWKEFEKGSVELAEEMLLDNIYYHNNADDENLIPLDNNKKLKKANPYSSYGLFKGKVK